jgi:two-component system chemotaxis response regulator CheB
MAGSPADVREIHDNSQRERRTNEFAVAVHHNSVMNLSIPPPVLDCSARSRISIVAVAGSAGAVRPMQELITRLPADFPTPIVYVQHLTDRYRGRLPDVLQRPSALPVRWAVADVPLGKGVHVCPPGHFCRVRPERTLEVRASESWRDVFRAGNTLFASVSQTCANAIAIILSGLGSDGAIGARAIHANGGTVLVQDEASAYIWGMPQAALMIGCVDLALPVEAMASFLIATAAASSRHAHRGNLACSDGAASHGSIAECTPTRRSAG